MIVELSIYYKRGDKHIPVRTRAFAYNIQYMLSRSPKEQRSNESTAVAREEEFERERGLESVAPHERVHRGLERVDHQRGRGARDELLLLLAAVDLFGLRESRETTQSARDAVQRVRVAREQLKPRVQASLEQQRIPKWMELSNLKVILVQLPLTAYYRTVHQVYEYVHWVKCATS